MRLVILALLSAVILWTAISQVNGEVSPPLTGTQISNVSQWARLYDIPTTEALEKYRQLISSDWQEAGPAWEYFDKRNAFEIAAAALVEARSDNTAGTALYTLERKKDFSRHSYEATMQLLEALNAVSYDDDESGGEHPAGIEMMKMRLSKLIARWLGIPDPDLMMKVAETKPGYRKFIAEAKAKAAGMTGDSPF